MKQLSLFILLAFVLAFNGNAQKETFRIVKEIKHTPVVNQGNTGTCWAFSTTSFLESEIMRLGFPETKLSEMYFVDYGYKNKVQQYLMYHSHNNFGQGGLSHDVMNVLREHGMATYKAFPGEKVNKNYSHGPLIKALKKEITETNKKRKDFNYETCMEQVNDTLDKYIGKLPEKIKTANGNVTPQDYRKGLKINPDDYIELSSFTHHPFYTQFVLEIPDNWAHALYYNLPIDELMEVLFYALNSGYSVCWDGDVSEKLFQHKNGKADLPEEQIGKVDQKLRQETFLNRKTTDDHLMHIVGLSKDSKGRTCFYTKNSWGAKSNNYGGYLHITEDYARLKTIAFIVHKDAIPEDIKSKLKL
jgi:bleomycin hydrolase